MDRRVLAVEVWHAARDRHRRRVTPWVDRAQARRGTGGTDPIEDFLFTYYGYRPGRLLQWHPGSGVALDGLGDPGSGAQEYLGARGYEQQGLAVGLATEFVRVKATMIGAIRRLLVATASNPARFGCFGLHEWAMVHRVDQEGIRHGSTLNLRVAQDQISAVVESGQLRCTHFDAFRFYAPAAAHLNEFALTADTREAREQAGCLHATMDLYKWATKLSPMIPSELVADCFELALDVRRLDMAASPYDISSYGIDVVAVETQAGREEYAVRQRAFSVRAQPLRDELIRCCTSLLAT